MFGDAAVSTKPGNNKLAQMSCSVELWIVRSETCVLLKTAFDRALGFARVTKEPGGHLATVKKVYMLVKLTSVNRSSGAMPKLAGGRQSARSIL